MSTRPGVRVRSVDDKAAGFVLVGVIMFILVLTILGLSLFSLSGFEAQFFGRSLGRAQAFYHAAGGQDRARWVLLSTSRLENVQDNLPPGVDSTIATQEQNGILESSGPVQWGGAEVTIRVVGEYRGVREIVQANFIPTRTSDYYKRLMTLSGTGGTSDPGLWIYKFNGAETRWTQTWLEGRVWQNAPSPGPLCDKFQNATDSDVFQWITLGRVPDPDVQSYVNAHWGAATLKTSNDEMTYDLDGRSWPDKVGFYKTASGGADWSLLIGPKKPPGGTQDVHINDGGPKDPPKGDTQDVRIDVRGTVVWMFDSGFQSGRMVRVRGEGDETDLLVLVALPCTTGTHRNTGLALFGGLDSPTVPVILVSPKNIKLMHTDPASLDKSSTVRYLSIYSQSIELMGPSDLPPARSMTLQHVFDAPEDLPGGAVDRLYQLGLLPNINAGENRDLPMRAGTWRQIAPNN